MLGLVKEGALSHIFIPDLLRCQAVSGKAPAGMRLIDQDALFHRRVLVHNRFCLLDISIEYPDAGQVAPIGDGADYGQQPSGPEEEIPFAVLPDDLLRSWAAVEHDAVLSGRLACAGREGADMFVDLGAGTKPMGM